MSENVSNGFLGLDEKLTELKNAKVGVILAPLENTTSFQQGTSLGPKAFIEASHQVELWDIESKTDFSTVGVYTFKEPRLKSLQSQQALEIIQDDVEKALEHNLWPITVGGEHTISLAPIRALHKKYPNLSVLQIDAHADLRETYAGTPYSHACIMKRVMDLGIPAVAVGIRNYSKDEALLIEQKKYPIFHDFDIQRDGLNPEKICSHLTPNVYITVDIDGFTPGECPGTGTPEPGGITWWHAMTLFKYVFSKFNVVGMDVNEIMPINSSQRTEFFAAKLAYKMIGMKFFPESTKP